VRHVTRSIAVALVAVILMALVAAASSHPQPGYPMHIIATAPPTADDILAGEGFMYDATRWKGYVLETDEYVLCRLVKGEPQCGLLPSGTVFLVPAPPDSL